MTPADPSSFARRIVDNTLPQSAFHYLQTRRGGGLDPAAPLCFDTFVDAYINSPVRCAVLPGKSVGQGDEFIELWLNAPDVTIASAWSQQDSRGSESRLTEAFAAAVAEASSEWAGFLCFQLTPEIARQYKSRVVDWRDRLAKSLANIGAATSELSRDRDERIGQFRNQALAPALARINAGGTLYQIDAEYLGWVRSRGVDLATFAVAYGYDWYERGRSYGKLSDSPWVGFHPLRSNVISDVEHSQITEMLGADEVRWSPIIRAYADRGLLPADPLVLCDVLVTLRDGVQSNQKIEFGKRMSQARSSGDIIERYRLERDAVVEVLDRAGIRPVLRQSARRSRSHEATAKLVEEIGKLGPHGTSLAAPMAGEVVRYSLDSRRFERLEFGVRRMFRPKSVWRTFEVPGLTSEVVAHAG